MKVNRAAISRLDDVEAPKQNYGGDRRGSKEPIEAGYTSHGRAYFENITVKYSTDKALLVRDEEGHESWIPRKAVHDDSEISGEDGEIGDEGTLIVCMWFAEKVGIA